MSRDIRFRIWHPEAKKHFYQEDEVSLLGFEIDGGDGLLTFSPQRSASQRLNGRVFSRHPDQVWEQYTGIKDKDGNPIYEGDILEWHIGADSIFRQTVEWKIATTGTQGHGERFEQTRAGFSVDTTFGPGTIVGNRFQHPHLLSV